jgi:phosphohistidine swiveling domain-containing protein
MDTAMLLWLHSSEITLSNAGGKGLNLARLLQAGFNVPAGFILTTEAYQQFLESRQLNAVIQSSRPNIEHQQPSDFEVASTTIRSAFAEASMPTRIAEVLKEGYAELAQSAVAVRSSATTEDLPDLSFAGQQDTYLNIRDETALLKAVISCWSSLWTARAIGYRSRNNIPHDSAAIAVVVQEMVDSDVSGVLFTANPITGLRSQTVIDATFGLGEALVAGQVEPDHFVVDHRSEKIISRSIGSKRTLTRSVVEGGTEIVREDRPLEASLDDAQILELAAIARSIQALYDGPQDIEWAYRGEKLHILQSRPITSLFPLPELCFDPLIIWISFGSVQGILGPITPLGREGIRNVIAGAAPLFRSEVKPEEMKLFVSAGERIWIRISDLIRNPIGNRLFERLMGFVEPSVVSILRPLRTEPALGAGKGRLKFSTLWRVIGFFGPVLIHAIRNARRPEAARERFDRQINEFIASLKSPSTSDRDEFLNQTLQLMRSQIQAVFQFVLPNFIPILGPGMASLVLLTRLAGDRRDLALEITRGLSNNVTTQMDLALWDTAVRIKADEAGIRLFQSLDAGKLAARYLAGELPKNTTDAIDDFMTKYGMRGVGEIDIGSTRWREDPTSVFQTLLSYLRLPPESAPDVVFKRGVQSAEDAIEELVSRVRKQRFGRIKARLVRAASHRARTFLGSRETPKFLAIQAMGMIRESLLIAGTKYVEAGMFDTPDDLFYLNMHDLEALSQGQRRDWRTLIEERRQRYEREKLRKLIPRVLASDGRAFYEGVGAKTDTKKSLIGSAVSPGVVEGTVRVVLDPHKAQLEPGDILVCPGTDPAWTPLFLAAGGLVTEVGGMMTHGSVVAREYGIPAVVGVHEATTRLKDGQRIRLDGSAGTITLLDGFEEVE